MTTSSSTNAVAGEPSPAESAIDVELLEPTEPGTSPKYLRGRTLRRYGLWYGVALAALSTIYGGVGTLLIPNQVQLLEFGRVFTGGDSGVDLQALTILRDAIAQGTATATGDQSRLLGLLTEFDASRAQSLALVASIALIATTIAQPLIGVFADRTRTRLGRRAPWMIVGVLLGAAFLAGMRFAPSVAVLVLLWSLVSVAMAAVNSPLSTTLADRIPENRRGGMSGIGGFGSFFGGVLGSIGAGVAFTALGLNAYFVFAGLVTVAILVFVWRVRDRSSIDLVVPPFEWKGFFVGFTIALRSRDYRWVWIARVLLTFGYGVSTALSFFMLQSYVKPALSQAEAIGIVPLLAIVGLPSTVIAILVAGSLSDRLGRRKTFVFIASVLMAGSMLIPLISPTVPALFAQVIVAGLAFGIYIPVDQALIIDVLPDQKAAGRDLGVANLATNLGQSLAPTLAAGVVALTAGYQFVWVAAAVLVAFAALAILPVRRK